MRCFLLMLCIVVVFCQNEEYKFTTKYIDMPLDHFSFTTNTTFKLRYLVNNSYYTEGKPIFFYTGNEGDISVFAQNTGFMFDLAEKIGALIIFAEHRYYGETLPFGNESYSSPKNLGYLSAQQALADYVYLIDDLQKQYVKESSSLKKLPVIAFGGSYGGMLSAWLRMKYPYSVLGAIASSAPIWQFKGLTPCENFNKIVTDVVRGLGSRKCVDTITKSWSILRDITKTDKGKTNVSTDFQLCKALQSQDDVDTLLEWLGEIYTNLVMVNYPYPTNFLAPLPGHPVREFCQRMDSVQYTDGNGLVEAIAKGLQIYTNYTGQTKCNNIQITSTDLGEKGWSFQVFMRKIPGDRESEIALQKRMQGESGGMGSILGSCTDMIMPMCSTDKDMFETYSWDFQKYSDYCFKQFSIRPRSEEMPILEFGGKEIETASNIVFSNGLLDPWSSGGVLANISSQVLSVLIPDGAHHFDLRGKNPLDSENVKNARHFHEKQIRKWLDKYYFNNLSINFYSNMLKRTL